MSWSSVLRPPAWRHGGRAAWARSLAAATLVLTTLVAGCGFHLRGEASYTFQSVYVNAPGALTLSAGGSVREYLLIKRVSFRLHDADGSEWLPPGEIALRRTYSFSESEVLARDTQEQRLLRDMQTDAVQQLVRRLQAAKKPA